ncbi:MAG TPA: hypothetical protein PK189_09555, partial [bacterium]|nr:hypothetical protein [bacterium]
KKLYLYRDSSYSQYVSDLFVSYEERYKNLYFFAEAWDLDGLSTDTYPYANDELPDTFNLILKNKNGDVIKITMTETGNNTNLYKNTITNDIPFVVETIQPAPAIYAERGETIVVYADVVGTYSGDTYPIELIVQQYKQPTIKAVRFFTNSSYTQELNRLNLNIEDRLYPQVIGEGSASILKDTITVLIKSSSSYGTDTYIRVLLTETEVGSEIYRVTTPELIPLIYYRTDDNYNYIYANKGDTIEVYPEDQSYPRQYPYWDFTYIALPQSPDRTYTINVFTDATYTNSTLYKEVARDAYLYFEVRGDIGNNILIDTTMIALNKMGSNDTIYIELTEIGPAQGVYRGFARLGDVSNITQKILGVNYGDTVIITSLKGVNLAPPLFSPPPVILVVVSNKNPNLINSIRFKNANYSALLSENLLNNGTLSKVLNRTKLYVELNGEDASPLLQEFTTENFVRIFSYNPNYLFQIDAATQKPCIYNKIANETYQLDSTNAINQSEGHISLTLWETDKNTGQYRGDVNLSTVNDTYKVLLKADTGYTIVVWCKDSLGNIYFDTAIVADFEEPKYITSLQFMEADYQNILNREVTFGEVLNIELFGDIANTLLADIAVVEVINLRSGDKVEITLKETGLTTGFYRGIVALSELPTIPTNIYAIPPILNVDGGDTILLQWKKNPQSETDIVKVIVPIPKPPNNIKEIAIYKASDYAIPYGKYEIPINSTLYIQAIEEDTYSNPAVIDTIALYITNDMLVLDTITVILTETTMNSRLYRGVAYLTENITNETQDKIKATFGTKLTFIPYISDSSAYYLHSKVDSAVYYVANLLRPKSINQITFMESDWSRPLIYPPLYGDRLHIQVDGEDANPLFPDKFNLAICSFYRVGSSIVMRADTFLIEMTETDKNSGVYRAELDIFRVSFPTATPPQIKAFSGDSIVVTDTITNKSASIEVKDSLEPNDVQELNFIYPNTEITMLEEEFDLEYIGIEATAFDANYRVRDKINLAVKIYSETNVLKDTKTITLTQIDNTSIFYRHIIKLVEDYTIEQTDTSYTEIKVQRGDTIIIIWSPPVNAPIWADTKILSKKVAVFNPPDEVEIKVYKYINGNRVSLENFNYEFDEGDTLLFEAIETSNSLSSKWVRDTVSIQIITYNPTALQSAPKKYVPLTGGIINTKNYTLTETTKSSKIYRVELFITNDPAKAGDTNVIYGVTSGDVLLVYLEIQSNQLVLSAGRFRPRNEINAGPYPNPYNIKYHKNVPYITFAGVQANSKIKILDSTGKLVIELNENSDRVIEGYKWDLKNEDGNFVSSGIYIYIMTTKDGQKKIGKIGIIR